MEKFISLIFVRMVILNEIRLYEKFIQRNYFFKLKLRQMYDAVEHS